MFNQGSADFTFPALSVNTNFLVHKMFFVTPTQLSGNYNNILALILNLGVCGCG